MSELEGGRISSLNPRGASSRSRLGSESLGLKQPRIKVVGFRVLGSRVRAV